MTRRRSGSSRGILPANRREVLLGLGAAAGGSWMLGLDPAKAAEPDPRRRVADAPVAHAEAARRQPFHGLHQAGIVTPRPAAGIDRKSTRLNSRHECACRMPNSA